MTKYAGPIPNAIKNFPREFLFWLDLVRKGQFRELRTKRIYFNALSEDPDNPAPGQAVMWLSDGTGTGNEGDIVIKDTDSGGTTTSRTI